MNLISFVERHAEDHFLFSKGSRMRLYHVKSSGEKNIGIKFKDPGLLFIYPDFQKNRESLLLVELLWREDQNLEFLGGGNPGWTRLAFIAL